MLLFLIGYMACGKSTIGRKLNQRLKWRLYDTDKMIVADCNMSISQLFEVKGEAYFRELENNAIKSLSNSDIDAIISTGGGAPVWHNNMDIMNNSGLTIYLSRSAESIANRLSAFGREKRPKLRGLSDDELISFMREGIAEREEHYSRAKLVINADLYTDDEIVDMIASKIKYTDS